MSAGPLSGQAFPPKGKGYNSSAYIYSAWGSVEACFWLKGERGRDAGRTLLNVSSNHQCQVTIAKRDPRQKVDLHIRTWNGKVQLRIPTDFSASLTFRINQGTLKVSPKMKERVTIYHHETKGGVGKISSIDEALDRPSPPPSGAGSPLPTTPASPPLSSLATQIQPHRRSQSSFSALLDTLTGAAPNSAFLFPSFTASTVEKPPIHLSEETIAEAVEENPPPASTPNRYGTEYLVSGDTVNVRTANGDLEIFEVGEGEEETASECTIC
ncbi:hypothetical protein BT69DRAFT_788513 [Atractiella rhizophila]|nr:hypothetical protein BT69DRAFT_788513 [Atractiella rhizophila]